MPLENTVPFVVVGIVFSVFFWLTKLRVVRKVASYQMYAVRDDLICLVATGKLKETDPVFEYYYTRVNRLLETAPNIGIDDALEAFLFLKTRRGLEESLSEVVRKAEQIRKEVEGRDPEVCAVIARYYESNKRMIVAHSNFIRFLYLAFVRGWLSTKLQSHLPNEARSAIRVADIAERTAISFREICSSNQNHQPA